MIVVKVKKEDFIKEVQIKGHALYAEFGKDIVCAGVSSIVTTTINAILRFDEKAITYKVHEGFIEINVLKKEETTKILLENMLDLLKELEIKYKKNIKIEEVPL